MSCTRYRSLRQLEVQRPYTIVRSEEMRDGNILLFLRGSLSLLLSQTLVPAFQDAKRLNVEKHGEAAKLKLKFYGYTNFDGGNRIIKISGKGFTRYLV